MEPADHPNGAIPRQSVSSPQTILLHVLSPSSEVPNKLTFPLVPASTTIGELKIKIRDEVTTSPAPERQRLIYRGKALTQDSITLKEVFGQEAVRGQWRVLTVPS